MADEITLDVPETRIEQFLAAAAGVEGITLDEPETRIEKYLYKIAQGGGSGGLPPVTESDAGKVLSVNNSGVWGAQEPIGKKFIVTLTPTALDYSGTMDKTVAEINAAYEAGQEIVFQIRTEIIGFNVILSSIAGEMLGLDNGGSLSGYLGFHALFVVPQMNVMIHVSTMAGDTGADNTYSTTLYDLTPTT